MRVLSGARARVEAIFGALAMVHQPASPTPPPRAHRPFGSSPLPPGRAWLPHVGKKQGLTFLRAVRRRVEKLKDPESVAARARLDAAVAIEPDPVYAVLHLTFAAMELAEHVTKKVEPTTWAEAMNHLLDKFDERAKASEEKE